MASQTTQFEQDYDDSDDEEMIPRAFYVPTSVLNEDLSTPPVNGEQYLRRTMEEAKNFPAIMIANIDQKPQRSNQLPKMPETKVCNSNLLPTKDWQITAMADFSKLRLKMDKLREKITYDPRVVAVRGALPEEMNEEDWLKIVLEQDSPSTRFCMAISQVKLQELLGLFPDWLNDKDVSVQVGCRWVYCLLACLELPVLSDVFFSLRQIARTLINYRAEIDSLESEELPHINLIVCLIARYFQQMDLADL